MTRFTKTLIAATALVTIAGNAHAGDTFTTSFNFDKAASIETNYANYEQTAKQACKKQSRKNGRQSLGYSEPLERACVQDLVAKAVSGSKNIVLIAYHQEQINPNAAPTKLASAK